MWKLPPLCHKMPECFDSTPFDYNSTCAELQSVAVSNVWCCWTLCQMHPYLEKEIMRIASRNLSLVQTVSLQGIWQSLLSHSLHCEVFQHQGCEDLLYLAALAHLYFSTTYSAKLSSGMSLQAAPMFLYTQTLIDLHTASLDPEFTQTKQRRKGVCSILCGAKMLFSLKKIYILTVLKINSFSLLLHVHFQANQRGSL